MLLDETLQKKLADQGIGPKEFHKFIRDVSGLISSNGTLGLATLNLNLQQSGWDKISIDPDFFDLLMKNFQQSVFQSPVKDLEVKEKKMLKTFLEKIFHDRGVDFRGYSQESIARRINRRMKAIGIKSLLDYGNFIDQHPHEYDRLFNEITVNVTYFFRNQRAFAALKNALALKMNNAKKDLKIWCAGCASGQEAYTVAMLVLQHLPAEQVSNVNILATDIDDRVLEFARAGVYDVSCVKDLSPDIIQTFFSLEADKYIINQEVRDLISFHQHNLVTDSFFKGMDIILCRNVLIYFNIPLQMKVIHKFYKSLDNKGLLLLGRYEMLLKEVRQMFACMNFDARLYQKK